MPRIRTEPEDFVVEELPLYPRLGQGPHLYLLIEKRLRATDEVLRILARELGVAEREVGYAGRKDRRALTRQWFSVPEPDPERLAELQVPGLRIVTSERHGQRLRVGELWGNRFELRVREVDEAAAERARQILEQIAQRGMPNRFGPQRFGRDGKNAERGAHVLGQKRLKGNRHHAWLMVSALQSAVFNRVLELRPAPVHELLPGDVAIVHATGEVFAVDDPVTEAARLESFEVSPTGPIFGTKMKRPRGAVAELERAAMEQLGMADADLLRPPRGIRLYGERRPLRVAPRRVETRFSDGILELAFELPAGSYATVLLDELFPEGYDEGPDEAQEPARD